MDEVTARQGGFNRVLFNDAFVALGELRRSLTGVRIAAQWPIINAFTNGGPYKALLTADSLNVSLLCLRDGEESGARVRNSVNEFKASATWLREQAIGKIGSLDVEDGRFFSAMIERIRNFSPERLDGLRLIAAASELSGRLRNRDSIEAGRIMSEYVDEGDRYAALAVARRRDSGITTVVERVGETLYMSNVSVRERAMSRLRLSPSRV